MHKMATEFTGQWSSGRNKRRCAFLWPIAANIADVPELLNRRQMREMRAPRFRTAPSSWYSPRAICLELGRHILKMLERDPRRTTLSAIVLLGFWI
jgi:hypothetical protein